MSVNFSLTSKTRVDTFKDNAAIEDITNYVIDASAWEEDNGEIASVEWLSKYGNAAVTDEDVSDGIVSANVSFAQAGRTLISIRLTTTSGLQKKIWLEVGVKDFNRCSDDYGMLT